MLMWILLVVVIVWMIVEQSKYYDTLSDKVLSWITMSAAWSIVIMLLYQIYSAFSVLME